MAFQAAPQMQWTEGRILVCCTDGLCLTQSHGARVGNDLALSDACGDVWLAWAGIRLESAFPTRKPRGGA